MKQLLFLFIALLIATITYSQPGTVDNTFGDKGFAYNKTFGIHRAIVQQPDGKLLTAGGYNMPPGNIARFLPDGTIDSSFGMLGFAGYPPGGGVYDMILQEDDKILTTGYYVAGEYDRTQYFVARFQPNGMFDSSFGKNGMTFIPDFKDYSGYGQLRLEKDGSIIINGAGQTNPEATDPTYSILCHLSADGAFDYNFGTGGRVLNYALISTNNGALAIQDDGKILQAGFNGNGYDQQDYVLCRYNRDGTLDNSFGEEGIVITQGVQGLEGHDTPYGIAVQPDGKIVLAGTSDGYDFITYMTALRYETNGAIDKTFGTGGRAYVSFKGKVAQANAIVMQPDGKFILAGAASDVVTRHTEFALCRINADGSLDSSFGIDGEQLTSYSAKDDATAYCATLQQDGKIVLGGAYQNNKKGYPSYLLIRYNGDKGQKSLIAKMKHWLHNHGINWQGLPANIRYYSVQYSKTGSGFAEQGKVSGSGSNAFQQYNFTVNDAGYYRIVAVDNKGYKTFSNKVMVTAADIAASASVYPNPVKDYVTVNGLQPNEPASISISNGSGAVLAKGTTNGGTQYRATTSGIKSGTYYINITTKGKTEALTFVKE